MKGAVVILAGGKSSRMGQDKALMDYRGKTFIQNIIEQVEPVGWPIFISGNRETYRHLWLPVIEDELCNEGPVMALATCFAELDADRVLVLSCDVPQIKTKDINQLLSQAVDDVIMYESNGRHMPLVAVYSQTSFNHIQVEMQRGERRLFAALKSLKTTCIPYEGKLHNVNTPKDLEEIL